MELFDASSRSFLAHLDHPHLAEVYDFVFASGTDYVVTEYVSGPTLRVHIESLPMATVVDYGIAILSAVGYLHDHGLEVGKLTLHDVVETGGQVKLTGLGRFLPRSGPSVAADLDAVGSPPR